MKRPDDVKELCGGAIAGSMQDVSHAISNGF
jgi:hypothetical protein